MKRAFFLILLSAFGFSAQAQAARFSGAYLIQICASDKNGKEYVPGGHSACQSYIAGIVDYHNLVRALGTAPSVDFCIPEGVDMYVLQDKVVRYLIKNEEAHKNFIAAPGVALALFSSFPCQDALKKKKNSGAK